ncbi:MAG TPA: hypothetical protein VG537_05690 [Candidatus Kapabacteria bacterium]|jgi:hypothetical protein|nr:hypothetical protein [Candidatus Kapabacteria bacterium]
MDTLNNATLTTYLNNLDQSGWNLFAADLGANFVGAFSSRFALTTRQTNALTTSGPFIKSQFVNAAQWVSAGFQQGALAADIIGVAFDSNPAGPPVLDAPIHVSATVDGTIAPNGSITVSLTITISH